jgi:phosphinothricin acetyltransferase
MPEIRYRNATQEDLVRIVEIYNSTIASRMVTADTEPVTLSSRQKWFAEYDSEKRPLWVVENSNTDIIVG